MAVTAVFDKWLGRLSGFAAFWPALPSAASGLVTAYLSQGVSWVSQFGAFGWWCAFALGAIVGLGTVGLYAHVKYRFAVIAATKKWSREVDKINPMKTNFDVERISIRELSHPVTGRISGKIFTNCELFGPENIALISGTATHVTFNQCEFVVVKNNAFIKNITVIENCNLIGGTIWNCTIFLNQDQFDNLGIPNVEVITYERPPNV